MTHVFIFVFIPLLTKNVVDRRCFIKNMFLKFSLHLKENTYVGISLLMKLQLFFKRRLRHRCISLNFEKNPLL